MTTTRKKLIEVALPLEAVNKTSAREVHLARPPKHVAPVVGVAARAVPLRRRGRLFSLLAYGHVGEGFKHCDDGAVI
jgi:hypothetical protein